MAEQTLHPQSDMSIMWKIDWLWGRLLSGEDAKRDQTEQG
jgi:hypothetical protein